VNIIDGAKILTERTRCGHTTNGNGFSFVCDLDRGHKGLHQQTTQLRNGPSRTNWGDDGKAPWATSDRRK